LPCLGQSPDHLVQVCDDNARVSFAGGAEVVFSKMQFDLPGAESGASSCREYRRLVDLGHSQDSVEEVAGRLLFASRHRQLHVMKPIEGHGPDLPQH